MSNPYDVAILGATASGYVAALLLAAAGRRVIVVAAPDGRTESPLADWVPADLFQDCPPLRPMRTTAMDAAFRQMQFHSADLTQEAAYSSRAAAGYLLRMPHLLSIMEARAAKAGVQRLELDGPARMELQESTALLHSGQREVRASVLIVAQGQPESVVSDLKLPVRSVPTGRLTICGLDAPLPKGEAKDNALHVVAYPGQERLGVFFAAGGVMHVRIISSASAPVGVAELTSLVAALSKAELLPARTNLAKAAAAIWKPPGGVALELETHLAKRVVLIGTAGGFASALTGQTLDPGARSAMVAAEIVNKAVQAKQPQDVLADYKGKWRDKLADRIRPPGTSLRMLLPIIFSNKAMANRFARAFLYGESI